MSLLMWSYTSDADSIISLICARKKWPNMCTIVLCQKRCCKRIQSTDIANKGPWPPKKILSWTAPQTSSVQNMDTTCHTKDNCDQRHINSLAFVSFIPKGGTLVDVFQFRRFPRQLLIWLFYRQALNLPTVKPTSPYLPLLQRSLRVDFAWPLTWSCSCRGSSSSQIWPLYISLRT